MFDRLKWAREEHGDFLLLALLFVASRLFSLCSLFRPRAFPFLRYGTEYPLNGLRPISTWAVGERLPITTDSSYPPISQEASTDWSGAI